MNVQQIIIKYKQDHPSASAQEIVKHVQKVVPGSKTSVASVSSTLSRAKMSSGRAFDAPAPTATTDPSKMKSEDPEETEAEALERISIRFDALERMTERVVAGRVPSLIVSGPPGMSKSWTVTECLKKSRRTRHDGLTNVGGGGPRTLDADGHDHPGYYDHIGGTCTAVGLYHALWNMRNGGILFIDDCDAVFRDEDAVNLLKVATDSTKERLVSWRKNSSWLDDFQIDKTFDFKGHIIFLTNIDFEEAIQRGHKDSEHLKALIDRALYLCLTLRSSRDFMLRIRKVAEGEKGMLAVYHQFSKTQTRELLDFVEANQKRFYNLSLRLIGQIAILMKADPQGWKTDITATKMRTI